MLVEEWRSLPSAQGYLVSSAGRVWRQHIIAAFPNRVGYSSVNIHINGHRTSRTVHALVLEAFVGPQPNGHRPCHKDGDKTNNNIENLHWVHKSIATCIHSGANS